MAEGTTSAPNASIANATNNAATTNNITNHGSTSNAKPNEYNPRWKGYVYILLASLVNFSSVSNLELENNPSFQGMWQISLVFGLVTFVATVVILLLDRFQTCCTSNSKDGGNNDTGSNTTCHFSKAMEGRLEGYTLLAFTVWWIIGVAHITQVGGVAYSANNIYFSSWLCMVACVYTLDQWSSSKDILSIHELTGVSATLKSWYLLFVSSLVTMGTSSDMHSHVSQVNKSDTSYGIVFGLVSTLASLFWILVHYRLIDCECLQVGGWIELSSSFVMIMLWIVGVSVLTQEGGIAATIGGTECTDRRAPGMFDIDFGEGCYVIWVDPDEEEATKEEDPNTQVPDVTRPPSSSSPSTTPSLAPSTLGPTATSNETDDGNITISNNNNTNSSTLLDDSVANVTETLTSEANVTETLTNETNVTGTATSEANVTDTATSETNVTDTVTSEASVTETSPTSEANVTDTITVTQDDVVGGRQRRRQLQEEILELERQRRQLQEEIRRLQDETLDLEPSQAPIRSNSSISSSNNDNTTEPIGSASPLDIMPSSVPSRPPFLPPSSAPSTLPSAVPSSAPSMGDPGVECKAILENQVPGSNLYFSVWICFFASFNVTLRWKAAQAMNFAKAQNRRAVERIEVADGDPNDSDADDEDDDDNDDISIPYNMDADDI